MKLISTSFAALLGTMVCCAQQQADYKLQFSTFIGGSALEWVRDVATDRQGNIYVAGGTTSTDFPTTPGAFQRTSRGGGALVGSQGACDVFVAKYNSAGKLIWSTYLGGPNYDRAYAIEVDDKGHVYIAGRASDGFPTTPGVVQPQFAGDETNLGAYGRQDAFVAKLSPDGSRLLWSTFIGEKGGGFIRDLDIDRRTGEVYVVMAAVTRPLPHITANAFQKTPQGREDMAVVKLAADGSRALYATYLGGSGNDGGGPSIRVDSDGYAYVTGSTSSPDIPTTPGAYSRKFGGGQDLYLARIKPDGSGLAFGTYLGGSKADGAGGCHNIALDKDGNVIVSGHTLSTDFPTTSGAIRNKFGGTATVFDKFVAKFSNDGTRLLASTYIDGAEEGLAVDSRGNIYFSGETKSASFPVSPDAYQKQRRGPDDAVMMKLSPELSKILYATYMGGDERLRKPLPPGTPGCREMREMFKNLPYPPPAEVFRAIAVDPNGGIVVAGATDSSDWPTLAAQQPNYGGCGSDALVVKFVQP